MGFRSSPCQPTPYLFPPQGLMHSSGPVGRHRQLVLVLEGELYLIPFALLKGTSSNEYLYERFALISVPSIRALSPQAKVRGSRQPLSRGCRTQHSTMSPERASLQGEKVGEIHCGGQP